MSTIEIDKLFARQIYKPASKKTHKGIQGHALIIGGSYGKIGSVVLASKAALKSGCGLITAFIPKCGVDILQISFPEAMVTADENETVISNIDIQFEPNAIAIGVGLGTSHVTAIALEHFLQKNKNPLVIDADAINLISKNKNLLKFLPKNSVITPHKKELQRLLGTWKSDDEKIVKIQQISHDYQLIVVEKGSPTLIYYENKIFENTSGNEALATAGSGDSLTGIITGLIAQGYEPLAATQLGVYLHGLTADLVWENTSKEAFTASDIASFLGKAFLFLKEN
ncbi:NAD(P)H-hydrate dehydratase [Flavobacterium sp. NST-5]|uniref:ADP-dependent (S)-NAD(P)H-hydrate dehydratase n=1 Tax=Flavobacterium ichthyis TaxID=2698827 RepID=A0ABW9Z8J6_9FLAO|nr:NAD(P)H-hydrate dehydratase [Flavobacterium ichthyis]NBL65198.1 NAD(P)H-hydrate dehydratase [Flavobacterium ichthyis]